MVGQELISVDGIPANQKPERDIPVEVTRIHFATEDGKYEKARCKLIDNNSTTGDIKENSTICQCGNHQRANVGKDSVLIETNQQWTHEERKGLSRLFENGVESVKHGKIQKLVACPCEKDIFKQERKSNGKSAYFYNGFFAREELNGEFQRLLNARVIEEIGSDYFLEPYVRTPQHIYCLNQQSRIRARQLQEEDYYYKPSVLEKPQTSQTNVPVFRDKSKDEDLVEEMIRGKSEVLEPHPNKMETYQKDDENDNVKSMQDQFPPPSENADHKLKQEKKELPPSSDVIIKKDAPTDKDDKGKPVFVQEIKYYEGNLNLFGAENKNEPPYFKITKTVTFENDRGKSDEKTLGIDSWVQTDGDYNDIVTELDMDEPTFKSQIPEMKREIMETPEPDISQNTKLDKTTSTEKPDQNVMGLELIKNDFVRFIAELFIEAIPREIYNRMMEGSERMTNEEFEVRVKSYDVGSTDSCNLKTCKMRNPDNKSVGDPVKNELKNEKNEYSCANPSNTASLIHPRRHPRSTDETRDMNSPDLPRGRGENTYDCQIILNGRRIFVKVNKSVEDLLLSGKYRNVLRIPPDADTSSGKGKLIFPAWQDWKDGNPDKMKMSGNCTCPSEMRTDGNLPIKGDQNDINKERGNGVRKGVTSNNARTDDNDNTFELGNSQRKTNNDNSASERYQKSFGTTPPSYGVDFKDLDKSRFQDQNSAFKNSKNLFWANVEYFSANEEKVVKAKKIKEKDYDQQNRLRSRTDCMYKGHAKRRQSFADEKSKKRGSGSVRKSDRSFPLFWDSQYLKYCDRVVSENNAHREGREGFKSSVREEKSRGFIREMEKRMMVAPNFDECTTTETSRPFCLFKLSDDNCEKQQYRDYTIANVTSMGLNSNPFDMGTITCRKCIETLKSCSKSIDVKWTENEQNDRFGGMNMYDYYWNGITGKRTAYLEGMKNDNGTKSDTTCRRKEYYNVSADADTPVHQKRRNCCLINNQYCCSEGIISLNSEKSHLRCEPIGPEVPCPKIHGICFNVNRITHEPTEKVTQTLSGRLPGSKDVGISTTDESIKNIQLEKKTSCTQTIRESDISRKMGVEKQLSYVYFSMFKRGSKANLKTENRNLDSEDLMTKIETIPPVVPDTTDNVKEAQTEIVKSEEKVPVMNEVVSLSIDSITKNSEQQIMNNIARKKSSFIKALTCWWRKKDKIRQTS